MKASFINRFKKSLKDKCPNCGKGLLYYKLLSLNEKCSNCNLSFSDFDCGDGPAFFAMSIISVIIILLAIWIEIVFSPPLWFHIILWSPLTLLLSIFALRILKSFLIIIEFEQRKKNK